MEGIDRSGEDGAEITPIADGGGMCLRRSDFAGIAVRIESNVSPVRGGGVALDTSLLSLEQAVLVGNVAIEGGGVRAKGASDIGIQNVILAYNQGGNLVMDTEVDITLGWSDFYNPAGYGSTLETPQTGTSLYTLEPGFLTYDENGLPVDVHLSSTCSLRNVGSRDLTDPYGTRSDLGAYGGASGDGYDLDGDGFPAYLWPGTLADAPTGFDPAAYDCDDEDAGVQ